LPSSLSSPVRESVRHQLPQKTRSQHILSLPERHLSSLPTLQRFRRTSGADFVVDLSEFVTTRFRNTFFIVSIGANSENSFRHAPTDPANAHFSELLMHQQGSHTFQLGSRLQHCCSGNSAGAAHVNRPLHLVGTSQQVSNPATPRWCCRRISPLGFDGRPFGYTDVAAVAAPTTEAQSGNQPPCQGFSSFTGADHLDVTQAFASIRPLTSSIERFLSRKRMNIDQHTMTRVHARNFRSATITAILFWTAQASLCPCLSSPSTHGFFNG